jgi:hypothetical protein
MSSFRKHKKEKFDIFEFIGEFFVGLWFGALLTILFAMPFIVLYLLFWNMYMAIFQKCLHC